MTTRQGFLGGEQYGGFSSSNVADARYNGGEDYLELGFKNGGRYGYHNVGTRDAAGFFDAKSKGSWVWDNLRVRGTVFGHQKPYAYIAGRSDGYVPKYYGNDASRAAHRRIGPSGRNTEFSDDTDRKVPMAYHAPKADEQETQAQTLPMPQSQQQSVGRPMKRAGFLNIGGILGSAWSGLKGLFGGQRKALGGEVSQRQGTGGDDEPIFATPGEYVVPKEAAQKNKPMLDAMSGNPGGGRDGHFAAGGQVGAGSGIHALFGAMLGGGAAGTAMGGMAAFASGGPAGIALFAATEGLNKLKETAGKVVATFEDWIKKATNPSAAIGAMAAPYASQVGNYNPATVERFHLALDNLSAAAGRIFEPIIDSATGFADELNRIYTEVGPELRETIKTILPPLREFGREVVIGFIGMIREASRVFRPLIEEISPLGKALGRVFGEMFTAIVPLTQATLSLAGVFVPFGVTVQNTTQAIQALAAVTIGFTRTITQTMQSLSGQNGVGSALNTGMSLTNPYGLYQLFRSWVGNSAAAIPGVMNGSGAPGGGMTMAAQQARHVGIEDVGLEARRQAYSGRSSMDTMADNTTNILAILRAALPPNVMAQIMATLQAQNALNGLPG